MNYLKQFHLSGSHSFIPSKSVFFFPAIINPTKSRLPFWDLSLMRKYTDGIWGNILNVISLICCFRKQSPSAIHPLLQMAKFYEIPFIMPSLGRGPGKCHNLALSFWLCCHISWKARGIHFISVANLFRSYFRLYLSWKFACSPYKGHRCLPRMLPVARFFLTASMLLSTHM